MTNKKSKTQATARNLVAANAQPSIVPGATVLISAQLLYSSLKVAVPFDDWMHHNIQVLCLVRNIDYIYAKGANTSKVIAIQKPLPTDYLITTPTSERIIALSVSDTLSDLMQKHKDEDIMQDIIDRYGGVSIIAETLHDITIEQMLYEIGTGALDARVLERKILLLDDMRRAFRATVSV